MVPVLNRILIVCFNRQCLIVPGTRLPLVVLLDKKNYGTIPSGTGNGTVAIERFNSVFY